jgi:hypothetical protein
VGGLVAVVLSLTAAAVTAGGPSPDEDLADMQRRVVATLSGWSETEGQAVPFARSTPEERATAAAFLFEALALEGLDARNHRYRLPNVNGLVDLLLPPYRGTNVWAELPATNGTSDVVILGAHYDSEPGSPGAVDNASGVAVLLGVARRLAEIESRSRSFLFVFFDQEEDDEVGSRAFVRLLRDEGITVHSAHVVDLAAWDPDGDGAVQIQSPAAEVLPLYRAAASELSIPLEVTTGASSDNESFLAAGLPSVGVFQAEMSPHVHRDTDTVANADLAYLTSFTRLVISVMRRLAEP